MLHKKKEHPAEKLQLHPRNQHRSRYDFNILTQSCPDLKPFVSKNRFGDLSIDFFNPEAVKMLNKALIQQYYHVKKWDIPDGYLCPPIPGRADYIHYMADVLGSVNNNKIPTGSKIKGLDIGIGANAVFPIIGNAEYGWSFVGSDIDQFAIDNVKNIITENAHLEGSNRG
jgi:23S rRNA (adenine1618-N6)-methyltransferase